MPPRTRRFSARLADIHIDSDADMEQDDDIDVENDDELDNDDGGEEADEEADEEERDDIQSVTHFRHFKSTNILIPNVSGRRGRGRRTYTVAQKITTTLEDQTETRLE